VRIVHINTYDLVGGAARAAYRLHDGLLRLGEKSQMFVLEKVGDDASVIQYRPSQATASRLVRVLRRKILARALNKYRLTAPRGPGFFTDDRTIYGGDPWQYMPENDLLQLHWVSRFIDYRTFFSSLPPGKPVVWTLHGMEALTGGCHYDWSCGRFDQQCGACPQLGSESESDLTREVWQRKRRSYQGIHPNRLHFVSPSRWLRDQAKRSSLLSKFSCSVIPNGLDTKVFAPRERRFARELLRIPQDAKVVLFVADGVDEPRKGFQFLVEALSGMRAEVGIFLVSLGSGRPASLQDFPHLHIMPVHNDAFLSCIYSAADVYVASSLQDNLPNTILESLACGVPVAAFDAGGVSDAVRPRQTGLLARSGDVAGLRSIISEILRNNELHAEMSRNCRAVALREYTAEVQARSYLSLYQQLLSDGRANEKSGSENV
jgi:glycosyltransferase involved in cell wall biosynthesis